MRLKTFAVLLALGAVVPSAAQAGVSTGTLSVSATVQPACTVSGGSLGFGAVGNSQADVATALVVNCTSATPYTIALDNGTGGAAATPEVRLLTATDGGGVKRTLGYSIYRDAARTQVWGNSATNNYSNTGTGAAVQVQLYGRLFASSAAINGLSYTDTVAITLSY